MERHYTKLLYEYLKMFPCVAILGVRQCGKTTMLKKLPAEWKILDLEKGSDFEIISRDPELFLRLNKNFTAIDECQLLPELFSAVRVAIDNKRDMPGRYIITGSSSPEILDSISESLAGRIGIIELAPFSLTEAYTKQQSNFYELIAGKEKIDILLKELKIEINISNIHEYWMRGGYPEPWIKNSSRFFKLWMQNYVQTYINRDILRLFPGINIQKYRLFLHMLSGLSGNIINYSDIARTIGVSQPTVRDYFQIAEGTFIWRNIPPYEKNIIKRVSKHPRGYIRDTGLLHFMLHIHDIDSLLTHPSFGHSFEGMVIEELLRGFNSIGAYYDYFYYRTGAGAEVDLVLEGEFGLIPIEIKYRQNVKLKDLRGIRDFIKENGCEYGIVINNDDKVRLYEENLIGIPFGAV